MIRPSRATIGGRPWRIRYVNQAKMIGHSDGDANCLGLTNGNMLTIYVADWVPEYMRQEILLHEVLHACVYGGEFAGNLADDADHEEHYISGLDSPLLATLRDNPDLLAYLTA